MFVELHAKSAFSFLEAASLPETLAARAAELEQPALALLDRDGVYGAPRFYKAATRLGVTPLVGAECTLADGSRLPVLVEDREGYQNLCRLLTRVKMRAAKGEAAADLDELAEHARGLVVFTGGDDGPVARALAAGGAEAGRAMLERLARAFGRGSCYVELQRHLRRDQEARNEWLRGEAAYQGLPLLASNAPRQAARTDRALLDVLTAIRTHTPLAQAGRLLAGSSEGHLKHARDMAQLFADCPEAIANTAELALRATFTLKHLNYRFPDYPLPPGQTPIGHLTALAEAGRVRRYGTGELADKARAQIARELELIGKLDLAGYFLIVWDLVEFCRSSDILVQGRGSAANSAVCYALGITAVDPVKMELLFERFLSEERGEWPDIDLDLPSGDRRERVIQYVYERYGRLGAAMTANVITYRGRSAAREVGKALGLPAELCDRLAKLVNEFEYQDAHDALLVRLGEAGCDPAHPSIRRFAAMWAAIQDLPRHLGQHSGGMVICQGRLDGVVPLEPATMPGRSVVQWDKDDCAAMGIVKVDLLGLGMMSLLQDAIQMIAERGAEVDLAHLPEDPQVYDMLQRADTIGLFQVESRAQMATLPRLRPTCFYDIVVQVAIIRPGPIVGDMVHPYLRRRNGREAHTVPHPSLEPILKRTLGVPLFQEQLLRMAMATAGFTGGEAEELRRAFGFKRAERLMQEVEAKLRAGMARQGITGQAAEDIVRAITSFALYGFPECVVGDTRVLDASTGRLVRIADLAQGQARVDAVMACDDGLQLRPRPVLRAIASGPRPVLRLRTELGRELVATASHLLLTPCGWRPLGALRSDDAIAAPRTLRGLGHRRWPRHRLRALAQRLGLRAPCVPDPVFALRDADLAFLLAALWEGGPFGHPSYRVASRRLAEDLQHLLLRVGIPSRLRERGGRHAGQPVAIFTVIVAGARSRRRFARMVARSRRRALTPAAGASMRSTPRGSTSPRACVRWDRIVAIEPAGTQETYDLTVEGDHNFVANDLVVHNSHAASFALLAYASAYVKAHHPAVFYAALLNNQPMGFYHPSTIARDAERHGHAFLPIDVTCSEWLCTVEEISGRLAVRLGLRYVKGLREATGTRIAEARRQAPFASVADLAARGGLDREELPRLAEVGALAGLVGERRAALWEAARAVRPRGALYDALPDPPSPSPLPPMTAGESLQADYAGTGLSLAPHPMTHERTRLRELGVRRAADLGDARSGAAVRVAGAVVVRQRPGTAKGVVFLNLEDETGLINVIVWPDLYRRCRREIAEPYLYVEGRLQREDGVTSVLARAVRPLRAVLAHDPARGPSSHDFH